MEYVFALLMLVIGVCAILLWRLERKNARIYPTVVVIIALAIFCLLFPIGRPLNENFLATNQVYENLTAIGDQNEILALIKDMDGKVRYYRLEKVPPKYFKVVYDANGKKVLQPFPPATPTD